MTPPSEVDRISFLLVDDDAVFRDTLAHALTRRGFEVRVAGSRAEALAVCESFSPERAVLDLRMPGGSGLELLRELKALDPHTQVVLLSGFGTIPTAIDAIKLGALNFLTKPLEPGELLAAFGDTPAPPGTEALPSLDRVEWEYVQRALAECEGNVSEAARRLGLHRRTLQRKLQKLPPRH